MDHMIQIPRAGAPDEPVLEGWTVLAHRPICRSQSLVDNTNHATASLSEPEMRAALDISTAGGPGDRVMDRRDPSNDARRDQVPTGADAIDTMPVPRPQRSRCSDRSAEVGHS